MQTVNSKFQINHWINLKHKPLLRLTLLFKLLLLTTIANADILTDWQDKQYIQKAFSEIALKNEYKKTSAKLLKWQTPINYQFFYYQLPKNPMVETLFTEHLKHLQEITLLPITASNTQHNKAVNLRIHLTKDENYAQVIQQKTSADINNLATQSHCMASFKTNRKNEIIKADIVIPVDHAFSKGLLVACVVEETTQIMGLPNDSDWVNPSIANDASKHELLTGLDYIMLKILYHPNIKAGMQGAKLQTTVKRVIHQLEQNNEISKAWKTVNQSGLYPYVNEF